MGTSWGSCRSSAAMVEVTSACTTRSSASFGWASALAARLAKVAPEGLEVRCEPTRAPVGGGSLPGFTLESRAVVLAGAVGAEALAGALRRAEVPVIARVADGQVLLDARTLLPGDDSALESAVAGLRLAGGTDIG